MKRYFCFRSRVCAVLLLCYYTLSAQAGQKLHNKSKESDDIAKPIALLDSNGCGSCAVKEPPKPDEYVPLIKKPTVDMKELAKKIVPSEVMKRVDIEGSVVLRVLVGCNGRAITCILISSVHELLNQSAIGAVMNITYTPAECSNGPIMSWLHVPVIFKLR